MLRHSRQPDPTPEAEMIATRAEAAAWFSWRTPPRPRRIAAALVVLWVLSLADLYLTLWAAANMDLYELNPLARALLAGPPAGLVAYKLATMAVGTTIFWRFRHNGRCELASWGTAGVYLLLAVRWSIYVAACRGFVYF